MQIYSTRELLGLNRVLAPPPRAVRQRLFKLRLWQPIDDRRRAYDRNRGWAEDAVPRESTTSRDIDNTDLISHLPAPNAP